MIMTAHIHKLILCEIETPDGLIYQDYCDRCWEKIGNPKDLSKFPAQELRHKRVTTEQAIFEARAKYLAKQASKVYSKEWHQRQNGEL